MEVRLMQGLEDADMMEHGFDHFSVFSESFELGVVLQEEVTEPVFREGSDVYPLLLSKAIVVWCV